MTERLYRTLALIAGCLLYGALLSGCTVATYKDPSGARVRYGRFIQKTQGDITILFADDTSTKTASIKFDSEVDPVAQAIGAAITKAH